MQKRNTGIVSVFLVAVLLFNLFGYMVISPALIAIHRNQVFSNLEKSTSGKTIDIALMPGSKKLIFKGKKKEIMHEGRMYDIIKSRKAGSMIIYTCVPDKKEDRLISKARSMEKENHRNIPASRSARLFFELLVKAALIQHSFDFKVVVKVLTLDITSVFNYHDPFLPIPDIPPRNIFRMS